jgi:hypothetical protein
MYQEVSDPRAIAGFVLAPRFWRTGPGFGALFSNTTPKGPTTMLNRLRFAAAILPAVLLCGAAGAQQTVFFSDFDAAVSPALAPGAGELTPVQGFAGLGPAGNRFGGSFLRSPTGSTLTVTLSNLPPHESIDLAFLFAAIDSLDGTGQYPSGDFLNVSVDGVSIFRESFANALAEQIQSYLPAPGVELARRVDLGFGGPGSYYTDSAYNMALEPRLQNIPHTAPTLTVTFLLEGPGIQPLGDESWAIDNLAVIVNSSVCAADFNADGFVDFFDFNDFVDCFEGGTCPAGKTADFNADGFADFFDFNDFVDAFESGC